MFDDALSSLHPRSLVLVVDDELSERTETTRMIRGLGYPARSCRRGIDALRFLRNQPGQVSAVVADLGMPGMDGGELVERALDLDRALRAILLADAQDPRTAELLPGYHDFPVVPKPVRIAELHRALLILVGPPGRSPTPASVSAPRRRARRRISRGDQG